MKPSTEKTEGWHSSATTSASGSDDEINASDTQKAETIRGKFNPFQIL